MNNKIIAATLITLISCAFATGYIIHNSISSNQTPQITPTPTSTQTPIDLRVFIAASLTNVVANMTKAFETANNCNLIVNSAGSSTLHTQITSGSPCDVFMSADQKWNTQLNNSKLTLNNNFTTFTTNSLIVILTPGNPKGITSLADLTKPGVKVILGDPSIPVGSYTNTTCWKIDSIWGNPSSPQYIRNGSYINFNNTLHRNVVSYELTVESVVSKVSMNLGTADAGIVFASDGVYGSLTGSQAQFVSIPASVNTRGTYGINVMANSAQADLAVKFNNFWLSSQGQTLLTQFGFNS